MDDDDDDNAEEADAEADDDQVDTAAAVVADTSTAVMQTICGREVNVQKLVADVEFMALVDRCAL